MGCSASRSTAILLADDCVDSLALNRVRMSAPGVLTPDDICRKQGSIFHLLPEPEEEDAETLERQRHRQIKRCRMQFFARDLASESAATVSRSVSRLRLGMERARRTVSEQIDRVISDNLVVLFSETLSEDSHQALAALSECAATFVVVEVEKLLVSDVTGYCDYLEEKTGIPGGLPCMFIGGAFVGGAAELPRMLESGRLKALCMEAGALAPTAQECRSLAQWRFQKQEQRRSLREAQEQSVHQMRALSGPGDGLTSPLSFPTLHRPAGTF